MSSRGWWGGKVIIALSSDDQKRQKSWCEYYEKEDRHCTFKVTQCCGSAHCEYYKKKAGVGPIEKSLLPDDVPVVHIPPVPPRVNAEQRHKTLADVLAGHTPPFGEKLIGKVVLINQLRKIDIGEVVSENHDVITIERDDGKIIKFDRKTTISQKTLWVLDNLSEE